jgi:hypothetical protein
MLTKQFRELNRQAQVIENHKNMVNKQETLEEAAENYAKQFDYAEDSSPQLDFIEGAKWQEERMYSEEEVKDLILKFNNDKPGIYDASEWFEQNKKK